jgi:hypothetical protein
VRRAPRTVAGLATAVMALTPVLWAPASAPSSTSVVAIPQEWPDEPRRPPQPPQPAPAPPLPVGPGCPVCWT